MDGYRLPKVALLLALVLAGAYGCGSPVKSEKAVAPGFNPNPGSGSGGTPDVDDDPSEDAGMFLRLLSDTAEITLHRADVQYATAGTRNDATTGNFSEECKILPTATGSGLDLFCIAEVEELDLYFSNMTLQYHAPPSMCSYITFRPYDFFAFEPGVGPTVTSHQVLADGTIVDVQNTENGVPQCQYDYRDNVGGPNCCLNSYTQIVTTFAQDGTFETTTTQGVPWGGSLASCLAGPGMSDAWSQFRDSTGRPASRVQFVEGVGFNDSFAITSPINTTFSGRTLRSNVWVANFYNPSDHVGGTGTVPPGNDVNRPVPMRVPPNLGSAFHFPSDTYVFNCLNRAEEVQARIRLMIRDWNQDPIVEGGDPDADDGSGDPNFPENPLNDRRDWLDFGLLYPGTSTFTSL